MKLDLFITKDGQRLRCGYTTGSCAAAAAKAAALMLEKQGLVDFVQINTPAGIKLDLKVEDRFFDEISARASIKKDSGDDPDNTDGIKIFAEVKKNGSNKINIDGGKGIGRIKKKGLFGQVGEAAINPTPKKMIREEVKSVSKSGYDVLIYAPEGEEIGKKTFNSNIGIEGGISIIGTKGIVYPMSEKALLDTIYLEIDMIEKNSKSEEIIFVPGNHGEKIAEELGFKGPKVKMSNYIGESLSYAYSKGYRKFKLVGHVGKFAKLAIGIFNTHSRVADTRMEAFIYYLAFLEAPREFLEKINKSLTGEEALHMCVDEGYNQIVGLMEAGGAERIKTYLKDDSLDIEVIIYSMERGINF